MNDKKEHLLLFQFKMLPKFTNQQPTTNQQPRTKD
jgi:hypothetical protein